MRGWVSQGNRFFSSASGSITVEFVVFAPVLIAALVFSFEFGRAFWALDVVTRDVRAGIRYLTRVSPMPELANCPSSVLNIIQTGSANDGADKHFPWKNAPDDELSFICDYNTDVQVITMTATVPVTLSFLDVFNSMVDWTTEGAGKPARSPLPITYPLSVRYQARYIGN